MAAVECLRKIRDQFLICNRWTSFTLHSGPDVNQMKRGAVPMCLPLFWRLGDLFKSAAGLLKLCQGVGRGQGWHGWILDKWMARVVTTEVSAAANATPTPGVVHSTGQDLGVKWAGLLQALSAVGIKNKGPCLSRVVNLV